MLMIRKERFIKKAFFSPVEIEKLPQEARAGTTDAEQAPAGAQKYPSTSASMQRLNAGSKARPLPSMVFNSILLDPDSDSDSDSDDDLPPPPPSPKS